MKQQRRTFLPGFENLENRHCCDLRESNHNNKNIKHGEKHNHQTESYHKIEQ